MSATTEADRRVAIVTGSSSGIGEATARVLSANGFRVVVNSATSVEAGQAVAASLDDALYVQGDVSDESVGRALIEQTMAHYGRLDVLVNNAGTTKVIPHADLDAVTDEIFMRILQVNVFGIWYLTRAALPYLKQSDDGVVVNVTSLAGSRPAGSSLPYAVSKAAANHLTVLLANVAGPVRVNAVAPGLIATPWTADWHEIHAAVKARSPLGRVGTPEDIADTILGVIRSRYMTGQVVTADGGLSMR